MKPAAILIASMVALAAPALAQNDAARTGDSSNQYYTDTNKMDLQASELIGSRIYATEAEINTDNTFDKADADWDDIGEINNLLVSRDGKINAVIVGVGGFLGLGEKNVALRMSELRFLKKSGDDADDYFVVVKSNKEQLEQAPEYKLAD
jgi:hypothetical protein